MIKINQFKNNELLTFIEDNKIKVLIDDTYDKVNLKKEYKMNLLDSNKGSYKGSFMNNYICKKFISDQKVNLTNIETNKILNYCKYFLLSKKEYYNYFLENIEYQYSWYLRSPVYDHTNRFTYVTTDGTAYYGYAYLSRSFVPFFLQERRLKNENS